MRNISRNVSSEPVSISNAGHSAQNFGFVMRGPGVCVNGTRSADLPELVLQCGETKVHHGYLSVGKNLQCVLGYMGVAVRVRA